MMFTSFISFAVTGNINIIVLSYDLCSVDTVWRTQPKIVVQPKKFMKFTEKKCKITFTITEDILHIAVQVIANLWM